MERRRRTNISEKMSQLHHLSKSLIGCHFYEGGATRLRRCGGGVVSIPEKADVLHTCIEILKEIIAFLEDKPELRTRLKESFAVKNCDDKTVASLQCSSIVETHHRNSKILSSECQENYSIFRNSSIDYSTRCHSRNNKEDALLSNPSARGELLGCLALWPNMLPSTNEAPWDLSCRTTHKQQETLYFISDA